VDFTHELVEVHAALAAVARTLKNTERLAAPDRPAVTPRGGRCPAPGWSRGDWFSRAVLPVVLELVESRSLDTRNCSLSTQ
jgi:hypothetical protein